MIGNWIPLGSLYITREYTLHSTIKNTQSTVQTRSWMSLLGNGFQRRTFSFLTVPNGPILTYQHLSTDSQADGQLIPWVSNLTDLEVKAKLRLTVQSLVIRYWLLLDSCGSFHVRRTSEERTHLALVRATATGNIAYVLCTHCLQFTCDYIT
jgi:hypothetical protein